MEKNRHMRRNVLLILILLSSVLFAQNYQWSSPIVISSGSAPDLVIDDSTATLHVVNSNNRVIYTVIDSMGNIISQEPVPGTYGDNGSWTWGPAIDIDRNGYPHILYRIPKGDYRYDLYYIRKRATGWSNPLLISEDVIRGYVVRLAVDDNDHVHIIQGYVPEDMKTPYGKANYYHVYNGALIRDRTHERLGPFRVDSRLEIDVTKDGYVHIVLGYPHFDRGEVKYYRSTDCGVTLEEFDDLRSNMCIHRNGNPDLFIDGLENLHFIYGTNSDNAIDGAPSIRYVRYENYVQVMNVAATKKGYLDTYKNGAGWGCASVATSSDGLYIAIAYMKVPGGELNMVISSNSGVNWSTPIEIAPSSGGPYGAYDGRNLAVIRAYRNHFYCVYPTDTDVRLKILRDVGDFEPVAVAGGPYSGVEGSPIELDMSGSSDTGENSGIVEYAWDWDLDGSYDFVTGSSTDSYTFNDDFNGTVILRVKDNAGQFGYDTTTIRIDNVDPQIDIGADINCIEGDTLNFTCSIIEPGDDSLNVVWDMGDGKQIEGREFKYVYIDEGSGIYTVTATVSDDDGGVDVDTLNIFIENGDPIAEAGGPYTAPKNEVIEFVGTAFDPGVNDKLYFLWDLNDDGVFETGGERPTASFPEVGVYKVWLKVRDEDGGVGLDSAEVRISSEAPYIVQIPPQIIFEGEQFNPINLDDFVVDEDNEPEQLTWEYTGNRELLVSIDNRVLTVTVPDSEWWGQETVNLTVTDPTGLSGSSDIVFKVIAVNDPPKWKSLQDMEFYEDDTLKILLSYLRTMVTDIDDEPEDLSFSIMKEDYIDFLVDTLHNHFCLFAKPQWYGKETVIFVVSDTSGATDKDTVGVVVHSVPDPPDEFYLIEPMYAEYDEWPDTIIFKWHSTSDPDSGSRVYYDWKMWKYNGDPNSPDRSSIVLDTTVIFTKPENMEKGIYFWRVWAWDETGLFTESKNIGIIGIDIESDVDPLDNTVPDDFCLLQNYPNPFNPETRITYHLPKDSEVRLAIYNSLGILIRVLDCGKRSAGVYTVTWDGKDEEGRIVPSGIYLYRLKAGSNVFLKKMIKLH